ncbi:MAG: hypothetical protein AB7U59_17220 [Desulfovibrionaceae bacterium]
MTSAPDSLPHDPAQLAVLFKPGLYSKKPTWRELALADVPALVAAWNPQAFAHGQVALWLSARAETAQGRVLLPWWDVESPDNHGDVAANIRTAQALFLRLAEAGLDDGLTVVLSGRGTRFVWPWAVEPELAGPFLAMIRDTARWPGIDPQPQVSGMPLALAGFRGHRSQGGKGNVHFHMLPDAPDLLDLTPDRYADMVAGPADPAACQRLVGALQPKGWTPPAWRSILDEYRRELALKRHIIKVKFPARPEGPRRVSWRAVEDHLDGLGIRVVREIEAEGGHRVKLLSTCPCCGKKGKAYLAASGRLKCFSTSCAAGEFATGLDGKEWRKGLSLREWAGLGPDRDDADQVEPEHQAPPRGETMSVEAARATIREALAGEDPALLLKIPAGVGKSHAALEHALDVAQDGVVLVTVPTTALAEELAAKARQMAQDKGLDRDVRQYRGRSKETCPQSDYCAHVASMGFSPALLVCSRCMSRDDCQHFIQLDGLDNGVVVAAHAAAPYVVPKIKGKLREWIVDESPLRDLFRHEVVYQGSFTALKARLVGKAEAAMQKIEATAEKLLEAIPAQGGGQGRLYVTAPPAGDWEATLDLWEAAGITEAEKDALSDQLAVYDQLHGEKPGAWQRRLWEERLDLALLNWLWLGLGEKGQGSAYVRCLPHPTYPITYRALRNQAPALPDGVRLVALDATGDHRELEALFARPFRVVDAAVELPPARRVHLKQAMGKLATGRLLEYPQKTEALVRKAVAHLRPQDRRVLLVTHLDAEDALVALAKQVDPAREWSSTHYWASRGVDCWRDCDACVAFGTPTANRAGLLDLELALFGADQAARDDWFSSLGPRDLTQAVNRVRPVLASKTIIIVGREWPTASLSAPCFALDSRRQGGSAEAVEMAYQRLLPLAKRHGVMFSELAALAGVFRAEDRAGLADWIERVQPWTGGETPPAIVPTLIKDVLIRVGTMGEGVLPPIQFKRRTDWSALMARLAAELDLPALEYKPRTAHGGGRGQAALGYLTAVRRFCARLGVEYDPTLWDGEARPSGPPSWMSFPEGAHLVIDGERVDAARLFPVEDPTLPRVASAAPG